jgi:hypothetical protein
LVTSSPAWADVEPVRLVYESAGACPDEAQFRDEIRKYIESPRFAAGGEPARTFVVSVAQVPASQGQRSRGSVAITGLDGVVSRREFAGQSCSEVVAALALTSALAMDPRAALALDAPPAAPRAEPRSPSKPALETARVAHARANERPTASTTSPRSDVDRPPDEHPATRSRGARWGTGIDAEGAGAVVPTWAFGGRIFVDVATPGVGPLEPSFRASLFAASTHTSFANGIGASLTWRGLRAEVCPTRVGLGKLSATVCLDVDAGELASVGTRLANRTFDSRPWVVPGALGRVTWPWSENEGPWIEGVAGFGVLFERYSFTYQPGGTGALEVWRMPTASAQLGLGAGYRFR